MKLYGRNCITERIKNNPKSIKTLFVEQGSDVGSVEQAAKSAHVAIERISKNDFSKKTQNIPSQGVIAEVAEFEYVYLEDLLRLPKEKLPVILFLDSLNDPQNLGGILRTAACFGGFAVVLPKHESVEVTEAVLRVAQGGDNYVPVAKAVNLSIAIEKSKKAGFWIAGAVVEGGEDLTKSSLSFPLGIVIGSESSGIRPGLVSHLDFKFSLPMSGARLSFNAAVATALFCYEITKQRQK
jgi:23S rRNA (guanosine2251-2'-O)-methyltransferase